MALPSRGGGHTAGKRNNDEQEAPREHPLAIVSVAVVSHDLASPRKDAA
jgi:hypothetical protein